MTLWRAYLLVFSVAFALGPLALRTLLVWRSIGRNPLFIESTETPHGFVQRSLGIAMLGFGLMIGLFVVVPDWYARVPAFSFLQRDAVRWLGLVLSAGGLILAWGAQRAMGQSWRFGPDRDEAPPLVTTGLFGLSRNPIYLAMMLCAMGVFLLIPDAVTFAMLTLAVVLLNVLVRLEEQFLRDVHGTGYEDYLLRTGRFLPRLRS